MRAKRVYRGISHPTIYRSLKDSTTMPGGHHTERARKGSICLTGYCERSELCPDTDHILMESLEGSICLTGYSERSELCPD